MTLTEAIEICPICGKETKKEYVEDEEGKYPVFTCYNCGWWK